MSATLPEFEEEASVESDASESPKNGGPGSPRQAAVEALRRLNTVTNPQNQNSPRKVIIAADNLADLRKLFDSYDVASTGQLDQTEMVSKLLPDLGITAMREEDLLQVMDEIDTDGDGFVDFEEFVLFYELVQGYLEREKNKPNKAEDIVQVLRDNKKRAQDAYLTDRQIKARERIYTLLYDLPCFAPDYVYRRWWDVMVLKIIVYCVIVPSVRATVDGPPSSDLLIADLFVALLNGIDIAMNINTAVQEEDSFSLVLSRYQIIRHYLFNGLMAVDVLVAVPWDHGIYYLTKSDTLFIGFSFVKVLKVLKYRGLFHLTNRGTMDPAFVRFYFWTVPLVRLAFKMIVIGHILTLFRLLISSTLPDTNCPTFGKDSCAPDVFEQYFYSFFWVWSLLTTQGTAALDSTLSFVYAAFVMLFSLLLQGHVVANMSAIILKSNVEAQNQDSMRGTLAIMKHYKIPGMLQQEVLSFQFHSLQQNAAASLAHTLERLPPAMQREVGLYVKVDLVTTVPMFQDLSSECRLAVANCLEQTFAEPYDFIISHGEEGAAMYFMMHGFADVIVPGGVTTPEEELVDMGHSGQKGRIVATIIRGDFFGEIALLKPELKRTASIQALTYCNLFRLDFREVQRLFKQYDEIQIRLEQEARSKGLLSDTKTGDAVPVKDKLADAAAAVTDGRRRSVLTNAKPLTGERRLSLSMSQNKHTRENPVPRSSGQPDILAASSSQGRSGSTEPTSALGGEAASSPFHPATNAPAPPVVGVPPVAPPPPPTGFFSFKKKDGDAEHSDASKCTTPALGQSLCTDSENFDIAPFLKKSFGVIAKHLEQGNEKLCRGITKELRGYSIRIEDLEKKIEDILMRLDGFTRGGRHDTADPYGEMFGVHDHNQQRRSTVNRWHQ